MYILNEDKLLIIDNAIELLKDRYTHFICSALRQGFIKVYSADYIEHFVVLRDLSELCNFLPDTISFNRFSTDSSVESNLLKSPNVWSDVVLNEVVHPLIEKVPNKDNNTNYVLQFTSDFRTLKIEVLTQLKFYYGYP